MRYVLYECKNGVINLIPHLYAIQAVDLKLDRFFHVKKIRGITADFLNR